PPPPLLPPPPPAPLLLPQHFLPSPPLPPSFPPSPPLTTSPPAPPSSSPKSLPTTCLSRGNATSPLPPPPLPSLDHLSPGTSLLLTQVPPHHLSIAWEQENATSPRPSLPSSRPIAAIPPPPALASGPEGARTPEGVTVGEDVTAEREVWIGRKEEPTSEALRAPLPPSLPLSLPPSVPVDQSSYADRFTGLIGAEGILEEVETRQEGGGERGREGGREGGRGVALFCREGEVDGGLGGLGERVCGAVGSL
ncbi:hypothetical protein Naga_102563g1, partial [Nannochloropsis gaditana]